MSVQVYWYTGLEIYKLISIGNNKFTNEISLWAKLYIEKRSPQEIDKRAKPYTKRSLQVYK